MSEGKEIRCGEWTPKIRSPIPCRVARKAHRGRQRPSLRMRWLMWRARFSIPTLLARTDERKAVAWIAGINGGLAIVFISLFAWLSNAPLVFPALGPTAFILFSAPFSPAAAPRSVILGHWIGMASGFAAWFLVTRLSGGAISLQDQGWPLLCSASLALALSSALLLRFSCPHPPACASALVVAVGGVTDWLGLLSMAAAVVLLTVQAVCINRIAGVRVPTWSPG